MSREMSKHDLIRAIGDEVRAYHASVDLLDESVSHALGINRTDLRCLDIALPGTLSLRVFVAGFTMAISPGKLGEVLKAVLVRDLVGTPVTQTASVVMAERLTDVAGLVGWP